MKYCVLVEMHHHFSDAKLLKDLGDFLAEQLNQQLTNAGLRNKCQKQSYESVSEPHTESQTTEVALSHCSVIVH